MAEDDVVSVHHAARNGQLEALGRFLQRGQDMNAKDKHQRTPLHLAAWAGQLEVVKVLLNSDQTNARAKAMDDMTALHFASQNGHAEVARHLINAGINVNAKTKKGATSLHLACQRGHTAVVELLLKRKACPYLADKRQENALDKCSTDEVKSLIQQAMQATEAATDFKKKRSRDDTNKAQADASGAFTAAASKAARASVASDEEDEDDDDLHAQLKRPTKANASVSASANVTAEATHGSSAAPAASSDSARSAAGAAPFINAKPRPAEPMGAPPPRPGTSVAETTAAHMDLADTLGAARPLPTMSPLPPIAQSPATASGSAGSARGGAVIARGGVKDGEEVDTANTAQGGAAAAAGVRLSDRKESGSGTPTKVAEAQAVKKLVAGSAAAGGRPKVAQGPRPAPARGPKGA